MPHIEMSFKSGGTKEAAKRGAAADGLPLRKGSKPQARWVLDPFASCPMELSDTNGLRILPVTSLRADMYDCIRRRDCVALQELSTTPLVLGQLERSEVQSLVDLLGSNNSALQLLGHAVSNEPKAVANNSRSLHVWVREMEHAIAACAVVGLDPVDIVPLREALDLLAISYGRSPDMGLQQMNREILGAMFGREMSHLRRVIHTCEQVGNLPAPEHTATLVDQARRIVTEQTDAQSRLAEELGEDSLDISMMRGVAMDAAIAMISPASDAQLKDVLHRLHSRSGMDHLC